MDIFMPFWYTLQFHISLFPKLIALNCKHHEIAFFNVVVIFQTLTFTQKFPCCLLFFLTNQYISQRTTWAVINSNICTRLVDPSCNKGICFVKVTWLLKLVFIAAALFSALQQNTISPLCFAWRWVARREVLIHTSIATYRKSLIYLCSLFVFIMGWAGIYLIYSGTVC